MDKVYRLTYVRIHTISLRICILSIGRKRRLCIVKSWKKFHFIGMAISTYTR